jgi:hypothetical protein
LLILRFKAELGSVDNLLAGVWKLANCLSELLKKFLRPATYLQHVEVGKPIYAQKNESSSAQNFKRIGDHRGLWWSQSSPGISGMGLGEMPLPVLETPANKEFFF